MIDWSRFKAKRDALNWVETEKGISPKDANKWLLEHVPKEQYYQSKIMEWLKHQEKTVFAWKATQGAYSRTGIPDICVIVNGKYFGFEIKRPFYGVPSAMQLRTIRQIKDAGGQAYIVTYVKEVADILLPELEATK